MPTTSQRLPVSCVPPIHGQWSIFIFLLSWALAPALTGVLALLAPAALAATATTAAVLDTPADASDVSAEIGALSPRIDSAELYLVGRDRTFRAALRQADVMHMGCKYVVSAAPDIDSLVALLSGAGLTGTPATALAPDGATVDDTAGVQDDDARIVVRLHAGDNSTYTLVTGPDYSNAPSSGQFQRQHSGAISTSAVAARAGFERDVHFWAAQHAALAPSRCHW